MHKKFYIKAILFWFVLLLLAITNATVREFTYKPLLEPSIGMWAHQLSSVTAIIIFFVAIYLFLKFIKEDYKKIDLLVIGFIWFLMTLLFEVYMNYFVRSLSLQQILYTYYFWKGELWIFVLLSLLLLPMIADKYLKNDK